MLSLEAAIEACSEKPTDACELFSDNNLLAAAVHKAFYDHNPLILNPDAVWMTIAQGLAYHVNQNAEELRDEFVTHQGKEKIEIFRPDFVKGSKKNAWEDVFPEFASQIKARTKGDVHDLIVSDFSTTDDVSRICSQITLMDAMQSYFEYVMTCGCGIPYISLRGTVADWQEIRDRAEALGKYNLRWWTDELVPVLDKFVEAAKGEPDVEFFQSICNVFGGSGICMPINGWIQTFFPYLSEARRAQGWGGGRGRGAKKAKAPEKVTMPRNKYLGQWRECDAEARKQKNLTNYWPRLEGTGEKGKRGQGVRLKDIPSGVSSAPFTYNDVPSGKKHKMGFYGGLAYIRQDKDTGALEPMFGWAVADFGEAK